MRALAVQFSVATDGYAVQMEKDAVLLGFVSGGNVVLSYDPSSTIANSLTLPTTGLKNNLILATAGSGYIPLATPVSSGEVIFVSSKTAGTVMLYFDQ